jgi:hypothetical protein
MKKIYEHLIGVLQTVTNKFNGSISVQRYDESLPNQVGIILLGSRDDETCISGETEWEALQAEIHITCENNADDIFENIDILRDYVEKLEDDFNTTVPGLDIVWINHLGAKVRPAYTNAYGLEVVKAIVEINYNYLD